MEGTSGSGAPAPSPTDEGPSRIDVLLRNRRRLLIALGLIVLAAAVAVGSTAVFTSSDANAGNAFAVGDLEVDGPNEAIFTAENMAPGDVKNGSATIENTGSVSGEFSMSAEVTDDSPGSPKLSDELELTVTDNATDEVVYGPGSFEQMEDEPLGEWSGGEKNTYDFAVEFPSSIQNQNAFEGTSTEVKFIWNAVSN